MKKLGYQSKRRWAAGVLLLALVISPFAVKAESLAEAIDRLTRELVTLSELLGSGADLTVEEQSDIVNAISRISDELTDLQNAPPQPTTMEIIVDTDTNFTQAQFKDAGGVLVTADFYFSGPTTPTTTSGFVNATIVRAAETFGLSSTSLAQNVGVVPSFSGPEVFEPESTTVAVTTPSITPSVTVTPGRTQIHQVIVTGDARSYDAQAQIVFAPEPGFPGYATSTYDYSFSTTYSEWDLMFRLPELDRLVFAQLATDTGLPFSALRANATISFDRFDNQFEVRYRYRPSGGAGYDLSTMFGVYSVLEEVRVTAGDEIFSVVMTSDQDERLSLTIAPHYRDDRDGRYRVANRWDYRMSYSVHGVVTESDSTEDATRTGIRDELLYALAGIGDEFGVTDDVVINDLVPFMLDHTVYYETDSYNMRASRQESIQAAAAACHTDEIESKLETIAERYFSRVYQTAGDTTDILELYAPIRYMSDDDGWWWWSSRCRDVNNSFFPNI